MNDLSGHKAPVAKATNDLWQMKFIRAVLFNDSFVVIYNKAGSAFDINFQRKPWIIHEIIS